MNAELGDAIDKHLVGTLFAWAGCDGNADMLGSTKASYDGGGGGDGAILASEHDDSPCDCILLKGKIEN